VSQLPITNKFFGVVDLNKARSDRHGRTPAPHQSTALEKLGHWFSRTTPTVARGGIIVLPTGGGKTFTAMHFCCRHPLSQGFKIIWLAHTHHLLEQAYESIVERASQIAEPRHELRVRVVSGTPGHSTPSDITPTDDVLIGTVQTIGNALNRTHPRMSAFIESTDKLFVVIDEAHHSPAPSYRELIKKLKTQFPSMFLLGLTATPRYTDVSKRGWLGMLYPQGIIHEVTANSLMTAKVLAKPTYEEHKTTLEVPFDERAFEKWASSNQDIPERIIDDLARNRTRNDAIVSCYVTHRERYGKTIIFADRSYQCEYLSEALRKKKVRADVVYSHINADPGSASARNRRTADDNAKALKKFKNNELDVLINVRMLTEGTDVPKVQSVFLTRQTTSSVLLTQMVGRALRGPKFGGTNEAYIVSFIDNWKHHINFAEYSHLEPGQADEGSTEYRKRPPYSIISIELIQRLVRQMDTGQTVSSAPFLQVVPVGWYYVSYEATVEGSDETTRVDRPVMIHSAEEDSFSKFLQVLRKSPVSVFGSERVKIDNVEGKLKEWIKKFFKNPDESIGGEVHLKQQLFSLARHVAQQGGTPKFYPYEDRDRLDLDLMAIKFLNDKLGPAELDDSLRTEYERQDQCWRILFYNYTLFKSQFDACMNRLLDAKRHDGNAPVYVPAVSNPEALREREPSEKQKKQIRDRDQKACLCCGFRKYLQIDHIAPAYFGGVNSDNNLQTLCRYCNNSKGTRNINFRNDRTTLTQAPHNLFECDLPTKEQQLYPPTKLRTFVRRTINLFYQCSAVSDIKIGLRGNSLRHWKVTLKPGNNPKWIKASDLKSMASRIRSARAAYPRPSGVEQTPLKIFVD